MKVEMVRLLPYFQPIQDVILGKCLGYEATIQGEASMSAVELFTQASLDGPDVFSGLDRRARMVAVNEGRKFLGETELLFLNVSSLEALRREADSYLSSRLTEQLVFEITEQVPIDKSAVNLIESLARSGIKFAIDDFGKGISNWQSFVELPIKYLKMDMYFVHQIHKKTARGVIRNMVELCRENNIKLILEGVETKEQYQQLRSLNCQYMQGYFLGHPATSDVIVKKRAYPDGATSSQW